MLPWLGRVVQIAGNDMGGASAVLQTTHAVLCSAKLDQWEDANDAAGCPYGGLSSVTRREASFKYHLPWALCR
jgi:hypothetical protein